MKKMFILGMAVLILSLAFVGCGDGDGGIIPSEFQGTWKWVRSDSSGHTITLKVTDSKVTRVVSNDPGGNDGTITVTITKVKKDSVQKYGSSENWTEYHLTVDVPGGGYLRWGLSSDKKRLADPSVGSSEGYPRVYIKQK